MWHGGIIPPWLWLSRIASVASGWETHTHGVSGKQTSSSFIVEVVDSACVEYSWTKNESQWNWFQ